MTNEQAEEYAKTMTYEDALYNLSKARAIPYRKATFIKVNELIKALSQEPCNDAISRAYIEPIIEELENICINGDEYILNLLADIKNAPPVTQKSGKWIDYRDDGFVECPFCGHATNCEDDIDELHYCFYCGAKMIEPQESEDKE